MRAAVTPAVRSPVLVGRSAELATVRRLVAAAAAGSGGALLVAGEAGIGKTRLLDEAARCAADAGFVVLSGRAVLGGGTYRAVAEAVIATLDRADLRASAALRPYRAALGRLLPGWAGADPVQPTIDPVVLLGEGLVRLLRAVAGSGCLLRLEDLHWADEDTIALVEHVAGVVGVAPVLLAVSARDDAGAAVTRRLAAAPGMTTLRLRRLGRPDVAALAAACQEGLPVAAADLDLLLARSAGLPFLVEELLDAGDGIPPTLAGLVSARLDALGPDGRDVLVAAAVLGGELDWRLLGSTAEVGEPVVLGALRASVDSGMLVANGDRLSWPHALTMDAVLATVLPPERAVLARRAAQVLADRAGPDDEPRAAQLFAEAGEPDRSAELLIALAGRDVGRGALRSAERLLARAAATGARTAEVTAERVGVLTLVGRVEEAIDLGDTALGALTGDQHAELCLRLARAAVVGARWEVAQGYVERAGRPDDPRSLVLRADSAFGAGRAGEAAELSTSAVARAEEEGAPGALCEALVASARAAWRGDLTVGAAALRRAAQVAAEHGLTPLRVEALAQLGMLEALTADDPVSLRRARELALDAGMLAQVVSIDIVLGDYTVLIDGPRAAEPIARRAVDAVAPLQLPDLQAVAEGLLAFCLGATGDAAGMAVSTAAALRLVDDTAELTAWVAINRAVVALLDHDLHLAQALADSAMTYLLGHDSAPPLHVFGLWALLRTATGDRDAEARAQIRSHPAGVRLANRAALDYADAIAAGRAGLPDEATSRFAAADAALAGQGWWRRVLRLMALEAAVADGWGDPVPELRVDLEVHQRAGDVGLARTCRDLLRRAGQPSPRERGATLVPAALRALGVTGREVDVLDLVTQGMTNAQIAARLYLSPRTVDTHVASLLAKTGSSRRGELGSWAPAHAGLRLPSRRGQGGDRAR